mgnify:CR=1 FL=1
MEITWHAQSCFRFTERNLLTVVTDPYHAQNGDLPKLKADVVTISRDTAGHNNSSGVQNTARGETRVIDGPGEYEMGGVFITGVSMRPDKKKTADVAANSSANPRKCLFKKAMLRRIFMIVLQGKQRPASGRTLAPGTRQLEKERAARRPNSNICFW